jgi:hypothetical protein
MTGDFAAWRVSTAGTARRRQGIGRGRRGRAGLKLIPSAPQLVAVLAQHVGGVTLSPRVCADARRDLTPTGVPIGTMTGALSRRCREGIQNAFDVDFVGLCPYRYTCD